MLAHRCNDFALPVDILAGIGQKLHITRRLHDAVDADGELGEEAVRQVVDDHADDF